VLDPAGTADVIEEARNYALLVPIILAVLCGMRRGEIAALRWRSLDLDAGRLSVVASIEQTKAGCREKDAKSGRGRAVALPALVVEELRRHRLAQAQAMLAIGVRVTAEHHVVMRADAIPLQPNSTTQGIAKFLKKRAARFGCTGCGTRTRRTCWRQGFIPRSPPSAWGTARWGSRSTSTAMFCQGCRRRRPSR
jgi:integrase